MKNCRLFLFLTLALGSQFAFGDQGKVCILHGPTEESAIYMNLLAKDQGLFQKNNLKLEILHNRARKVKAVTLNEKINQKIKTNSIIKDKDNCDFIVLSFEKLLSQGQDTINKYKVLYSSFYGVNYDTHFIVKKDSQIKSLNDLANKNVRLGQLGIMLAFKNMMAQENANAEAVKLFEVDSVNVLAALKNNQIAMGSTYFPTMQVALASGEATILRKDIFATYLKNPYPQSIILVNKSTLESKPEMVNQYKSIMANMFKIAEKSPMVLGQTLRDHTKELGMAKWEVTNAQIEKGEEHYHNLNFVSANNSITYKNVAMTPKDIFTNTMKSLQVAKFNVQELNFSTLF